MMKAMGTFTATAGTVIQSTAALQVSRLQSTLRSYECTCSFLSLPAFTSCRGGAILCCRNWPASYLNSRQITYK